MSKIFEDNSQTIGSTPLVRLNRVTKGRVLAKIESRNPSFSVKCRIGANLIWDAEKRGVLTKGKEIIEPTSGNTGIALAMIASIYGIDIELVMPASSTRERTLTMEAFGAKVTLLDSIEVCRDYAEEKGIAMAMHQAGTPVSFMANVHCAAATQNFLSLEHQ